MKLSWFALLEDLEVFSSFQGQQVEPDQKFLAHFDRFLKAFQPHKWHMSENMGSWSNWLTKT